MATPAADTKPKPLKRRKSQTKDPVPAAMAAESGTEATPADKASRVRKKIRKPRSTEKTTESHSSVEGGGAAKSQVPEEPKKPKRKAEKAQALTGASQVVAAETANVVEEVKEDRERPRKRKPRHKAVASADADETAPSLVVEEQQVVSEAKEAVAEEQGASDKGRKKRRRKNKTREVGEPDEAAAEAVVDVEQPAAEAVTMQPQPASHSVANDALEQPKKNKKAKVSDTPKEHVTQTQKTENVKIAENDSAQPGEKKRARRKSKSSAAKQAATEDTIKDSLPTQDSQLMATGSSSEAVSKKVAPVTIPPQSKKSTKPKSPSPLPDPESSNSDVENAAQDDAEMTLNDDEAGSDAEEDGHLYGFSTDDEDSSDDEMAEEWAGLDVAKLPTIAKDDVVVKKKLEKAKRQPTEDRGVIYLGRIPHGFYEDQMRSYFTQFGDVTRLRLSRNKKTGRSKHYAFIEFDSSSVAKIVAETMDNYLLMGHILTCKVIPKDDVHPELWIGANKKWKVVPRDRIARVQHNKPRTEEEQAKAEKRLLQRQARRKRKLDEAGIKYDFDPVAYKKRSKVTEA